MPGLRLLTYHVIFLSSGEGYRVNDVSELMVVDLGKRRKDLGNLFNQRRGKKWDDCVFGMGSLADGEILIKQG